jgi:hypothetical protein
MFIVTRRGQNNRSAVLADTGTTKNGDAVVLRAVGNELQAYKSSTKGEKIDGFITLDTTDTRFNRFPKNLTDFNTDANAFVAHYETLIKGYQYLIEEGVGLAQTDRLVTGNYQNGDKLISTNDGTLMKSDASGQYIVATVKDAFKSITAGDGQRLLIEYHAGSWTKS